MNWLKLMGLLFIFSSCGGSQLFIEATATATHFDRPMPRAGAPDTFTFDGVTEYLTHWDDYGISIQPAVRLTYRQYIFDGKRGQIKRTFKRTLQKNN